MSNLIKKHRFQRDIIWINHPDGFRVSNYGHIAGKYLFGKVSISKKGYRYIFLNSKIYRVARVVAELFISNPENKPCVNHKNGIRHDDRVSNLEWCTYSENNFHAAHVLKNDSQFPKRSIEIYKEGKLINTSPSVREAARVIGGDWSNISKVCKGKRKQYLGYTFKYVETV